MRTTPSLPESLLLAIFLGHVLLVPGTKVEESFTLHAVRDALVSGFKGEGVLDKWDHVEFKGAVPRSFIPPLALAGLSKPVLELASRLQLIQDGVDAQIAIRLTLAFCSALSLIFFSRRVAASYGAKVAKYFLLLLSTSFHVPFWAGRTIPNMLVFPFVQVAFAFLITPPALTGKAGKPRGATQRTVASAFALFAFAAAIGRLEIVALAIPFAVEHLVRGSLTLVELVELAVICGGAGVVLSVAVDTTFWQSPTWLWPEGQAAWFNVVEGRAAEWGVSPFYHYLFPALPKVLHLTLPFTFFSLFIDRRTRRLITPCIGFIILMSGLKHKEWRFIVYVVPAFFVAASAGIVATGAITASPRYRRLVLFSLLSLNLLFTFLGLAASTANYPGLDAVRALEAHLLSLPPSSSAASEVPVKVWVGVEAKMKGASNFALYDSALSARRKTGEAWYLPPSPSSLSTSAVTIEFDKSEPIGSSLLALSVGEYDYAILDSQVVAPGSETVFQAKEFGGVDWRGLVDGRVRSWKDVVEAKKRDSMKVVKLK